MSWFAKALVYATLLSGPGHLLAPAYQSLLIGLTGLLTGAHLGPSAQGSVDLSSSNLLTIYVSLCMASDFAPWLRRGWAIALGIALLVAIECATGLLGMSLARNVRAWAEYPTSTRSGLEQMLELSRWLGVPVVWGALLGRIGLARLMRVRGAGAKLTV